MALKRSNDRLAWVDNVKMVAMLFVILGHTWRIIHCPLPSWMSLFIMSFNMALFVIMTGYTSVNAIERINSLQLLWSYLFKITKRVLVPSAVFNEVMVICINICKILAAEEVSVLTLVARVVILVLFVIAYYIKNIEKGDFCFNAMCVFAIPLSIVTSSFWFLNMIWCVCVSVAIAAYLIRNTTDRIWGFILLYLIAFILSLLISLVNSKTSDFVHFFLIGYALRKYALFDKINRIELLIFSFVLGIVLISVMGEEPMNFWDNHFKEMLLCGSIHLYLLRIVASSFLCLFFMMITKRLSKEYNNFSFWGAQSLALYLVHGMMVTFCYMLPISYSIEDKYYLVYAIPMTLFLTLLSMNIIKVFMKYGITRVYFLGEN